MFKYKKQSKKIVVTFVLLSLITFGMNGASAAETVTTGPTTPSTITPAPNSPSSITPAPMSPWLQNNSTIKPTGSIMKWVCKTIMTTVAVSAYVTTVVVSDGVMMVIAREVIKYMAVPAIVCDWFF